MLVNVGYTMSACVDETIELKNSTEIVVLEKTKDEKYEFDALNLFTVLPA